MRIDRESIAELLEKLEKRDELDRGEQPLFVLGCFYDLGVYEDSICVSCRNYEMCRLYLRGFVMRNNPFARN